MKFSLILTLLKPFGIFQISILVCQVTLNVVERQTMTRVGEVVGKREPSFTGGEKVYLVIYFTMKNFLTFTILLKFIYWFSQAYTFTIHLFIVQ